METLYESKIKQGRDDPNMELKYLYTVIWEETTKD